jgi:hypothetical protein
LRRKFAQFHRFELKSSRLLAKLQICLHGCGAMAVVVSSLPTQTRVALIALVLISLVLELLRHRKAASVSAIQVGRDGHWSMLMADGEVYSIRLVADTISSPWLVWLAWAGTTRERRLLIFPDSLPVDQFRQLRVALRIAAGDNLV